MCEVPFAVRGLTRALSLGPGGVAHGSAAGQFVGFFGGNAAGAEERPLRLAALVWVALAVLWYVSAYTVTDPCGLKYKSKELAR